MLLKSLNKRLSLVIVIVLVTATIIMVGCSKKGSGIKFGAVLPLTGNSAQLGEPKKQAFEIAVDEINKAGGINGKKLELVLGDNKGDPKEGVSVMQKMVSVDKVGLFYMDITRIAYATAPIADQSKVIMFAGSTHPAITEGHQWVFRVFTSGDQESEVLTENLAKSGVKTIFILYNDDILGESFKQNLTSRFTKAGGQVLGSESFKMGQQDCREILTKAKNSGAEKILFIGYGVTFPTLIKQSSELNIPRNTIMGNIGFVGPKVVSLEPTLTDGIVFTGPSYTYKVTSTIDPNATKFIETFKARFGKTPDYTAAFAYDTIKILAKVIAEKGMQLENVRQGLLNVKNYDGVSGTISFRPNGDSYTNIMLAKYEKGKIVLISESKGAAR